MKMKPAIVQDTEGGVVLTIHVQPKASRTECAGLHGEAIKIRVAAPPIDGAANGELIRFLSSQLSIPRTSVRIQSGAGSRQKRVLVKGLTSDQVRARLHLPSQKGTVAS